MSVGIAGAGAMGSGIAQIAAQNGEKVWVYDPFPEALQRSKTQLRAVLDRLVEKEKINAKQAHSIQNSIEYTTELSDLSHCELIIEAIVERLETKQQLFEALEERISDSCILASNTSSISIASLAKGRRLPQRILGIHFFNPAPLMPLVEIIPSLLTQPNVTQAAQNRIVKWGKTVVLAKDSPGFIVNRVARPFYGEALKMLEEGVAEVNEIDTAMRTLGGFKMGPFELTDLIGHDVNYAVTETVWKQFFYDPRFKPSLIQGRMVQAGLLGRKSGRGFYHYAEGEKIENTRVDSAKAEALFERIFVMLVNEAYDALFLHIASAQDIDLAMKLGLNYPKGLLQWSVDYGMPRILAKLQSLHDWFGDDRYRPNPLLKHLVNTNSTPFA